MLYAGVQLPISTRGGLSANMLTAHICRIASHRIAPHGVVSYAIVSYRIPSHAIVLSSVVWHGAARRGTAWHGAASAMVRAARGEQGAAERGRGRSRRRGPPSCPAAPRSLRLRSGTTNGLGLPAVQAAIGSMAALLLQNVAVVAV